jgi:hypothetical protein
LEISSNIFVQISIVSLFAAFILGFYSIFEHIMALRFAPFVFERGLLFIKTTKKLYLNQSRIPSDGKLKTKTGQFKFIDNKTCYFHPRWERKWFTLRPEEWLDARPLVSTPFLIKGKISWQEKDEAKIEGRLPLGTSIFFLCLLVGFTAFSINNWMNSSSWSAFSPLILFGTVIGGMVLFCLAYEYERAEKIISELKEHI